MGQGATLEKELKEAETAYRLADYREDEMSKQGEMADAYDYMKSADYKMMLKRLHYG